MKIVNFTFAFFRENALFKIDTIGPIGPKPKASPSNNTSEYLEVYFTWSWLYKEMNLLHALVTTSVTRLGDFLDFGQLFKAFGNN